MQSFLPCRAYSLILICCLAFILFSEFANFYQTPNPRTLKTTDTVDEAIVSLLGAGLNGAPVLDPITNNLVGGVAAFVVASELHPNMMQT